MQSLPQPAEMERAFLNGDATYDGLFWAGVTTTRIYCRPSCPARKPHPGHLEYFAQPALAEAAGFRACRRCQPLATDGQPPAWIVPVLARLDASPDGRLTADELTTLGIDPVRVRRWFQKHHGVSFARYCRERRLARAHARLQAGAPLDDVALDSGFESHSGFRDAFQRTFGTAPGRSRTADSIVTRTLESPVGPLRVAATRDAICLVEFVEPARLDRQLASLTRWLPLPVCAGEHPLLDRLAAELTAYFAGQLRNFSVPLAAPGTPFQMRVWEELGRIPYGETIAYETLAERVGSPGGQRAVGLANGQNRIAIVIPCHRVVNKSGQLGGYGGGLWRKQRLLELERQAAGFRLDA